MFHSQHDGESRRRVRLLLVVTVVAASALLAASGSVAAATVTDRTAPSQTDLGVAPPTAQATATVCSYTGQDVTADNVALTSYHVSAPSDPPEDGQQLSITFVLENVGQMPVSFDSVFLDAKTPGGRQAFGHVSSVSLDPGETYTFGHEVTATEGDWSIWPAYVTANGQASPSPWQACEFTVQPPPDTEPPTLDVELSPDPPLDAEGELQITGRAVDDSGIEDVSIEVDGTLERRCDASPCSVTVGPFESGSHNYRVYAVDGAGNRAEETGSFRVLEPVSPLTVEVESYIPPPNSSLPSVIVAEALGDVGVRTLTIYVDGKPAKVCSSARCLYRPEFPPDTEHTFGAEAEDSDGGIAESVDGIEGTTFEIPGTSLPTVPIVTFTHPRGEHVFDRPERLAFDVSAGGKLRRVKLYVYGRNLTENAIQCGPESAVPDCPDGGFTFDETVPYTRGWNPITVEVDTDDGVHLTAAKDVFHVDPSTIETTINASHEPASPSPGESVTIESFAGVLDRDVAAVSSLEIRRMRFARPDEVLETCSADAFAVNITCETTYDPPSGRHVMYYYAVAEVAGDRELSTEPRPVVFDDGQDADQDGLTDYEERFLCTDERDPDTDRDGLLDSWEVHGHRFPDGHVVDLREMGAHPCRPDVFLEVDWWGNDTHSHKPGRNALTAMKLAYQRGGIDIHIDAGKYGGGEQTPHHDVFDPGDYYYENPYEYRLRKADNFDPHRLWSFHYAAFRHRTGRSFIVFGNSVNVQTWDGANWGFETAELFHELGHAVGLGHGGRRGVRSQRREGDLVTYYGEWDSYPNRRPNYPSSMNYLYYGTVYWNADAEQFVRSYDFSRADLPDLNESDLNERPDSDFARALRDYPIPSNLDEAPRGVADDWVPVVRYGCLDPDETRRVLWFEVKKPVIMVSDGRQTLARKVAGEPWQTTGLPLHPPGIDWNCDGEIDPSVEMNINGDGGDGGLFADRRNWTEGEVLRGREDWSLIPNRSPCPSSQQTERSFPSGDGTYEVPPAPSDAYISEGHDPPCSEGGLAPDSAIIPPEGDLGSIDVDRSPSRRAGKPITAEQNQLLPAEFCNMMDDDGDGEIDEGCSDVDGDAIPDLIDNCPTNANPNQVDSNGDYIGDACSGLPAAPEGLSATQDEGGIRLSWDPIEGTSGYAVWRRPAPNASLEYVGEYPTVTAETFVDDGAAPDESVEYVVRGINAMTGAEGWAATVTYDPTPADTQTPTSNGGLPPVLGILALVLLGILGLGAYLRRRAS